MENKEIKLADIVERLTAEEYVVMQLQRAEHTISENKNILDNLERDNLMLTKSNRALNQIVEFIFKNFDFEFASGNELFVSYGHFGVEDPELKQLIEKAIENGNAIKEEE